MVDFIPLLCPSCGAKAEVPLDIDRFACAHCGNEHIVKRAGGIVSLSPVSDAIKSDQTGADQSAAELSVVQLQNKINGLLTNKNDLIKTPQPSIGWFRQLLIGFGVVVLLIAPIGFVLGLIGEHEALVPFVIGLFLLGLGLDPFFTLKGRKESWEKNIGTKIRSMDEQIAEKQAELERLRNKDKS